MDPFEDFARTRGGPVDMHSNSVAARFRERWQAILDGSISANFLNNTTSIKVGWLARYSINAVVGKSGETYIIGINAPACSFYILIFNRLMQDPQTFPDIGQIDPEYVRTPPFEHSPEYDTEFPTFPKDPVRARWAQGLTRIALDFLFWHELEHIAHGHLDWIIKGGALSAEIDELEMSGASSRTVLERQTLEFDADNGAFQQSLRAELKVPNGGNPPYILEEVNEDWGTPENVVKAVSFAVYCVFRLFGDRDLGDSGSLTGVHPPPQIRMQLAIRAGLVWMSARCVGWSEERSLRAITLGIQEAEHAFNRDGVEFRNPYQTEWTATTDSLLNSYLQCWARIHPQLEALRLVENIPEPKQFPTEM